MNSSWLFQDPPNTTSITTEHVLRGEPIRYVYRDWDDGTWQFLPERITEVKDGRVVALSEMVKMDASLAELADLQPGWMARRRGPSGPWDRKKNHPFPTHGENGFYLEDATEYERLGHCQIPDVRIRRNLQVGSVVKLVFRFAGEWSPRADNECERMWVEVLEADSENAFYKGVLLNRPVLHKEISAGETLWFHALHVLDLDSEEL
jgi:hypothetical protein